MKKKYLSYLLFAGCLTVISCNQPTDSSNPSPASSTVTGNTTIPVSSGSNTSSCTDPLFIDNVSNWSEVEVNGGGMDAIRNAINNSDKAKPTRITVKSGTYTGQCLYIEDHQRSEKAPLWIRGEGNVQIDCHDGNGQAVDFQHSSYIAFDNFTIGPETGFYGDSGVHISGTPVMPEDNSHYGEYLISDHMIVRNVTARNLNRGPDGDANPESYESGCCDGIKANQTEWVWIINNKISRTARHGIDMVGVHHASVCGNQLTDMVGAGFGMEAKGGSSDILFEKNLLNRVRHRGIVLGGEGTDNVFMYPWTATYEGSREIARNNIIINSSEGGLGFYGCQGCTAVGNSVWFTSGYATQPHDFLRMYPSTLEASGDEWGGPRRVGEVLPSSDNKVINNLFGAADGDSTCALDAGDKGIANLTITNNLWWNGGKDLPECGDGMQSLTGYPDTKSFFATTDPMVTNTGTRDSLPDLTPKSGSKLIGNGLESSDLGNIDFSGNTRQNLPAIGALEAKK